MENFGDENKNSRIKAKIRVKLKANVDRNRKRERIYKGEEEEYVEYSLYINVISFL